ncbi:D-alanyl-D-alanine carboxypeptidase [Nitriliruptoraceae bacterium ZYF776]|nr:D-alanyl-D-alanine carboxypeptidase [Profundirhabdus halotolerans]
MRRQRRWRVLLVAALAAWCLLPTSAAAQPQAPPAPLLDGDPPPGWPAPPADEVAAVLLLDATTGQVLGGHDADERRPVASTVKVLTALTASARSDDDDLVTVGNEVVDTEGSSVALQPGDRWTVRQLLEGLLVRSGNDAAEALAAHVAGDTAAFVELMRQDAEALGLGSGTQAPDLDSPSGLGDRNLLSARDLATIARAALADPQLRPVLAAEEVTLPGIGTLENRNLLLGSYPGATGVKTGFTNAAGNSLVASAERDGRELLAVVLGAGPDPERFTLAAELLDHGFEAFEVVELEGRVELLAAGGRVPVEVTPTPITVPTGAVVDVDVGPPVRVPDAPFAVEVHVDGQRLTRAEAAPAGARPEPVAGGAALGRAVADGVHAALRAEARVAVPRR